ncbi:hypothetical protein E4U54_002910 [Claviceps lovelessii]|nr:hypothetical protein E4U54_002910 [Claviceps lovelessii]
MPRKTFFRGAPCETCVAEADLVAKLKNNHKYTTTNPPAASRSELAKSLGPGRQTAERIHPPSSRYSQAKSSSQFGRPRTVQGHRPDESFDMSSNNHGTMPYPCSNNLPDIKLSHMRSTPAMLRNRESSLSTRFNSLTLNDDDGHDDEGASNNRCQVTSTQHAKATILLSSEHDAFNNSTSGVKKQKPNTSAHRSTSRDI